VPARRAVALPADVDLYSCACLGMPAMTAHRGVFADGPVQGQTIRVTGGAGAVGSSAIQLAVWGGATVLATARTPPDQLATRGLFVAADITTAEGCAAVASAVMEQLGGIDIIVHVVGGSSAPGGGFAALDEASGTARSIKTSSRPSDWIGPCCRRCLSKALA